MTRPAVGGGSGRGKQPGAGLRRERRSTSAVEQIETILDRAARRGEHVPDTGTVMDHVVAPMMYRVLFRPGLLDARYARDLVATVFYRLMPLP